MEFERIILELQKNGNKRAVSTRKKIGMNTDKYLGVELKKITDLAKKIGKNHKLAEQLRKSELRDALLLSFFVDEPKKVSLNDAKNLLKLIDYPDLSDPFCSNIIINAPYIFDLIDEWKDSSKEMTKRCAYMGVCELAKNNHKVGDDYFLEFLSRIEREIGYSKNWVKDSMVCALNSIGERNEFLRNKTASVIKNIGKVKIEFQKGTGVIAAQLKPLVGTAP